MVLLYAEWSFKSIVAFMVTLIICVMQLLSLSALPSEHAADADDRLEKYGSIQKFLTLVDVVATITGLCCGTLAVQYLVQFMTPDDSP